MRPESKSQRLAWSLLAVLVVLSFSVAAAQSPATKTLWVAHYRVECAGVGPQKCLLVKEEQYSPWELFYGQIEGFDYVEGYGYELRVVEEQIDNPPADSSGSRIKLVAVLQRYDSMAAPEPSPSADPQAPRPGAETTSSSALRTDLPTLRGVLRSGLGPETRAFRPCGGREEIWVVDQTRGELWQRYRDLAGGPNQALLVEVEGHLEPAPEEGFGAHYAQQVVLTRVVEASTETTDCDDR